MALIIYYSTYICIFICDSSTIDMHVIANHRFYSTLKPMQLVFDLHAMPSI